MRRRLSVGGLELNAIEAGIIVVLCLSTIVFGQTETTLLQRHVIGSKVLTVTDYTEPTAFGGSGRVIAVGDSTSKMKDYVVVMDCEQYFDVVSVEAVDTVLASFSLRFVEASVSPIFVVSPLWPRVGQLDFPDWLLRERNYQGSQTLVSGDYLVEHVTLASDEDDHALILRSASDSSFAFNVYFCDAEELKVSFEDTSRLKVEYRWIGTTRCCEFEIALWKYYGEPIALRAVGLFDRSAEK
ncbi:hypothetical protein KQH82_10555 [bacterium]|nr:hypothetical protein [bacterium]